MVYSRFSCLRSAARDREPKQERNESTLSDAFRLPIRSPGLRVLVLPRRSQPVEQDYRSVSALPSSCTSISFTSLGRAVSVVLPPGQRTHSCAASRSPPNTCTTLSSDQYPLPAWISRAGPMAPPPYTSRICAPTPFPLPPAPFSLTTKSTRPSPS